MLAAKKFRQLRRLAEGLGLVRGRLGRFAQGYVMICRAVVDRRPKRTNDATERDLPYRNPK
jgi:hypothetical protein